MKAHCPLDDPWWASTRHYVESVADRLTTATTGVLMGPPLMNKATQHMNFVAVFEDDDVRPGGDYPAVGDRMLLEVFVWDDLESAQAGRRKEDS
jgi:hypothetical protein